MRAMSRAWFVVVWLLGCGPIRHVDVDRSLVLDADETAPPPLSLALRYDHPSSELGFGSMDLSASPTTHEIRVDLMMGTVFRTSRWAECPSALLAVDEQRQQLPLRYWGEALPRGVYDAVAIELTIEQVRTMSTAHAAELVLCGDHVALGRAQLGPMRDFVRRFDEMATYDGPSPPPPPQPLDWEPRMPEEDRATPAEV